FEAYAEMVHKVMDTILAAALQRFAITRVRVAHRLGEVPIGEASVVVVVASPHRGPAFDACRYVMDRLKHEAPIWKQEQLRDGDALRWVGELPKPGA
ncbi:MAG: Molybdopterin synthase catalytic subunit, partial [Planctomycetota bacterium]